MDRALSSLFHLSSSPLKRFYKFLLKRILGSFLQYDLEQEQIDVALAKGELELRDLELNVQMLNELCVDLPITFIRARIRLVRATIPWRNLLSKSCLLKLDGWELVVVPSEQVQPKASATFSRMLAQSVMNVDVDQNDLELQKSLASLGQHFRARERRQSATPHTPMSMSGTSSASGSIGFGTPQQPSGRHRDAQEDAEEKLREAQTAAAVRAADKRRKQIEQRRLHREAYGEADEDEEEPDSAEAGNAVQVDDDVNTDDDAAEEAHSVKKHSARQAAALDTANEGLKVVASFLEQVVSAIELEVTDITIRVQHQPKVGHKQTNLSIKLPWIKFSDLNKEAADKEEASKEEERKETELRAQQAQERRTAAQQRRAQERDRRRAERAARRAEGGGESKEDGFVEEESDADADAHLDDAEAEAAEDEAAIRREMELKMARDAAQAGVSGTIHLNTGPKYEYHKSLRFHGFRVELHEEAGMDGSMAQFNSSTGAAATAAPAGTLLREADPNRPDEPDQFLPALPEPQTIISGSMDQECIITLKIKMTETQANEPKLESTMFIQSLRALLTPRQLALLTDLAGAIGLSAKQVAISAQLAHQSAILNPPPTVLNAAGGFSPSMPTAASLPQRQQPLPPLPPSARSAMPPSLGHAQPLSHPDYNVIEGLLSQQVAAASSSAAHHSSAADDQFFDMNDGPASAAHHLPVPDQVLNLWSMESHILHCSVTLMESDEQSWATDWWSTPVSAEVLERAAGTVSPQPTQIVESIIPGITCNHLFLSVHHAFLNVNQTSAEATVKLMLGSLQLNEYLKQHRAPTRRPNQRPPLRPQPVDDGVWIGFRARPLISFATPASSQHPSELQYPDSAADLFQRTTRPVADPHLSVELRTSVDSNHSLSFNEPIARFFEPHENSTVNSRLTLSCQPATIHFDLGLGERLQHMMNAVTVPSAYLNPAAHPPSSTSAHSDNHSFTFDLQRMHSAEGGQPMGGEEILHRIADNQRRYSMGGTEQRPSDGASYSQTVLIAPTIHLNILFPATTLSQLQPHPYTRMEMLHQDPYLDARGILRPERIELELHEVSVANECEVGGAAAPDPAQSMLSTAQLQDAEWMIRFHKAAVFAHFPKLDGSAVARAGVVEESLDDLEMIRKRLLSTTYPSLFPTSASAAYYSHAVAASFISILTRATPLPGQSRFQPAHDDLRSEVAGSPSVDGSTGTAEEMFFDSLPHQKFWEVESAPSNGERAHRAFKQAKSRDDSGSSPQQPDAAIFESLALANSGMIVTVHLPVAALHLSKSDYDLVMFLYTIYAEFMEPPAEIEVEPVDELPPIDSFAPAAAPSMYQSTLSTQEEDDHVDINGLARSQAFLRHPAVGADDEDDADVGEPGSLSRSDSFSSDSSSEMFESVVGADSVILKHTAGGKHGTPGGHHAHRSKMHAYPQSSMSASANFSRPGAPSYPSSSGSFGQAQPSLLKPQASLMLPSLEELRVSQPAPDAPLTMDSSHRPAHRQLEFKGDDDEESGAEDEMARGPQFQPTLDNSSRSNSPRAMHHSGLLDHSSPPRESNHSDSDSDSVPGDSEDGSGILRPRRDEDDRKHVNFGSHSILVPQPKPQPPSTEPVAAPRVALAESAEYQQSEAGSEAAVDDSSSSTELNPTAIFDRASRTSGRAQLFQPAAQMSTLLPPVSELVHPSTLANSSMMRSSMMESRNDPAMFESFLQPPPGVFDTRASLIDASVDYSHLPPQVVNSRALPPQPLRQPLTHAAPSTQLPLTAQSLAQLGGSPPAPVARSAAARNVPPPITSASAFPSGPVPPVSTLSAIRPRNPFRHFMSLHLSITKASIVLQDDPELDPRAPLHPASAAAPAPPLVPAAGPPQSFLLDLGEVRLFQVVEFDNKPVSYIAIRAGDLTVREYNSIVTDERQLFQSTSLPIIFKTMGDDPLQNGPAQTAAAASPFNTVDAWGKPVDMERKYDDDDESASANANVGPLTSLMGGARQAREAASVAWSNPVLIVNVVIKLNAALSLRDTQAVVNLRALTLQYFPESVWIQKLMAFFLPTLYTLPVAAPTFNVSASPLPPAVPLIKDLIHVHLHGYDVSLDYNPLGIESRAVIALDHVHVSTTVYPDTTLSVLKVEVRDVNMFMTPRSSKATYAPTRSLSELGRPYLHRIAAASVFAHLESMGYARLATLDFLDVLITQNVPMPGASPSGTKQLAHIPALGVEVSNGLLTILTAWDSFQVFTQICEHFVSSVQQIQRVAEIDIQFDSQPIQPVSAPRSSASGPAYKISAAAAPNHSETAAGFHSTAFSVSHRAAYLLDDDEEESDEKSPSAAPGSSMQPVVEERNILDELDHNAFGADLGVAQVYQADPLQLQVNDDYHDLRERQTSLSLALQAAAEREIARARREALGGEDGLQRANSTSPPRLHANTHAASASAPPFVPGSDATAKWLTSRESEEMVERDRHTDFIMSLADSEARTREEEMAQEKEERRRRREEERKKEEGGHARDSKDQRVAPNVIDDHVSLPDDETRSGRARLRPPAGYPNSVSEILLINLSICWRMFGGQDWDLTRVEPGAASSAAASARSPYSNFPQLSPEDSPEVRLGDMGSVDINDFYNMPHEPFVRTPNSFGAPQESKQRVGQGSMSAPMRAGAAGSSSAAAASDVIPRGARQTDRVMEVLLRGLNVRFDQFPAGLQMASRVVVALDDIEVHDLISTSPFNMFLCYYARPGGKGRELGSSMLRWEMTSVRPDPARAREEYRVKLAVLPLRLNVDQEAVEFFVQFFSHAPLGQENAAAAAAAASAQEGADAPSMAAKFHEQYRQEPLSQAEANILAGLTEYTQRSGIPLNNVQDPQHARMLCSSMIQRRLVDGATIASAISFSPVHFSNWESGQGYDETIGVAVVQLLNRLLQQARSDSDPADDESDGEDDSLSAGIGGPIRRRGSDPLDSFPNPLLPPPMPADWIPADFARNHPNLVPFLNEAYLKYYDIIHAAHPELPANAVGTWRPPPSVLPLAFNESANQYRQRLMEAARTAARTQVKALGANAVREVDNETYIQSFQVTHKIVLCIDWKPNTFDLAGLRGGDFAQLANLLPLENMELDLKAVQMTGITGFARVGVELAQLWAYDLSRHQAHRYLAGVQPIRSMVNVGSGVADLVLLPLSHYKQHGNLKRGVQRGLSSFLKNVSLESMAAAARLAQGAQSILESVDDVLTYRPAPLPSHASSQLKQQRARNQRRGRAGSVESGAAAASSSSDDVRRKSTHISKRANQPESAADGFRQAYESLSRGLQSAASQMIVVPREEYYARGSRGAVKSALKAMPSALLSPVIGGMEAIAKALNGITNSIEPARRKENQEKFKSANT